MRRFLYLLMLFPLKTLAQGTPLLPQFQTQSWHTAEKVEGRLESAPLMQVNVSGVALKSYRLDQQAAFANIAAMQSRTRGSKLWSEPFFRNGDFPSYVVSRNSKFVQILPTQLIHCPSALLSSTHTVSCKSLGRTAKPVRGLLDSSAVDKETRVLMGSQKNIATVTPAGSNLLHASGELLEATDCSSLNGSQGPACAVLSAALHSPAKGSDGWSISMTYDSRDFLGWNNGGLGEWTLSHGETIQVNSAVTGITDGQGTVVNCHKVGDCFLYYGYVYSDGGIAAGNDEGTGGFNSVIQENNGYFHGTVPTNVNGIGLTTLDPNFVSGNNWTTDGTFLINTTTGVIHTVMTGAPAAPVTSSILRGLYAGSYLLRYKPVRPGSVPISTSIGYAFQDPGGPPVASRNPHPGTSRAVTLQLTLQPVRGAYTAIPKGVIACVIEDGLPEQAQILNTGTLDAKTHVQQLTLALYNNPSSLAISVGPKTCSTFSLDDDVANIPTAGNPGQRPLYYNFGSFDGNSILYGYVRTGTIVGTSINFPVDQSVAGPNSGITIFDSAKIIGNRSQAANPILGPNNMVFHSGDSLENPHLSAFQVKGTGVGMYVSTPCDPSTACNVQFIAASGSAVNSAMSFDDFRNGTPESFYRTGGGKSSSPFMNHTLGTFDMSFYMDTEPESEIFHFQNPAGHNKVSLASISPRLRLFNFNYVGRELDFHRDTNRFSISNLDVDGTLTSGNAPVCTSANSSETPGCRAPVVGSIPMSASVTLTPDGTGSVQLSGSYHSIPFPLCSDATKRMDIPRAVASCYATLSGLNATITFNGTPSGAINYLVVGSN